MKLRQILFIIVALVLIAVFAPLQIVNAQAPANLTITNYSLGCGGISITGTSDAPYIYMLATNAEIPIPITVFIPVINGQFSFSQSFPEIPEGTPTMLLLVPVASSDENATVVGQFWVTFGPCQPPELGPDIPASFTMRVIICDTPIYDSPAGSLVGSAAVTSGQTFYANPVDAIAPDGSHWTQIFVGAWNYPFIPSVCAQ